MIRCIAPLFLAATLSEGSMVTLQQGVDGYEGSTTRTIVDTRPAAEADDGYFHLRGSQNSLHARFELPKLSGTLARARLMIFLPSARKPNKFTEIFCHEAISGGNQISYDELTDYGNGRRRGAVDSVELFAPPHEGWPDFPFLPLGVPEGGRWIEFNITPLVEKWIAGEAANHGVLLIPADPPDRRTPSTWEIDVPTATYSSGDKLHPKLVLELDGDEVVAGMTDGMTRICDLSTRFGYRGSYGTSYRMSMAANEFEGLQVVVQPMLRDIEGVRLNVSDLVSAEGKTIPASDVSYFIEDVYPMRRNWMTRELMFGGKVYETTDPLLPTKPVRLRRHVHTPFYVVVRTRPGTSPGVYRGKIAIADSARMLKDLELEVNVWPYAIPEKWNFHSMGQFIWGNAARFHGEDPDAGLYRKYYDFLMEHRFSPTEQYAQILSPRKDLEELLRQGMNTVYLSGNFAGTDTELAQLKKNYETVKRLGALDYTLVYIGDETDQWNEMRRRADLVHAHLPGVQVMIGGSFPREELVGFVDIYDPQVSGRSKVYSLQEDQVNLIAESQKRGEEFYWYTAAGPAYPYPNVQVENPLIASRVLFWTTWKYGVTGFEYYCYNIWERNYAKDPSKRYPNVPWKADGWSHGWPTNGDGMLFYPGPISSLRFEAIRDGIEDWESHMVLRDAVEALRSRGTVAAHTALIGKAEALLKVDAEIVSGFSKYTMDPARLLAERERLGGLIAELMPLAGGPPAVERAASERVARQARLRRAMLWERHLRACEVLKVKPVPEPGWNALWPERPGEK
ncbi:MAG TPA: glycoside hydrolase domain-containing protein [Bryobacteraceae bacterium]|nr:glycoside hydrolase domain-containing protein [Bryobacteraceae bacterium]